MHNGTLGCVSTRREIGQASASDKQSSGSEFYFTLPHNPKTSPTPTFTSKTRRSLNVRSTSVASGSSGKGVSNSGKGISNSSKGISTSGKGLDTHKEASEVEHVKPISEHHQVKSASNPVVDSGNAEGVVKRALVVDGKFHYAYTIHLVYIYIAC